MSYVLEEFRSEAAEAARVQAIRLTIPARPEYVSLSRLALAGLSRVGDVPEEQLADLKLAITEACSNSVRHAYAEGAGTVQIVFELRPDRLVIEVSDDGAGFEPHDPGERPNELSEGGLGIAIIRAVADEFEIGPAAAGRGSRLRFEKRIR